MPDGGIRTDDRDAEAMALELSWGPLAPTSLYRRIHADLSAIRASYGYVAGIHYRPQWKPGSLIIKGNLSDIEALNESPFGPVTIALEFDNTYSVLFRKHYNPVALIGAIDISKFIYAEPRGYLGDGDDITLDLATGLYTFTWAWGDCPSGCIDRVRWVFHVDSAGNVKLVQGP